MKDGKFAYKRNLEEARQSLLDMSESEYKNYTAQQQVKRVENNGSNGLMRPLERAKQEMGSASTGMGLALMGKISAGGGYGDGYGGFAAPSTSLRPESRPQSDSPLTSLRPEKRPSKLGADKNSFKERMRISESSGKMNAQITLDDGRTMTGGFQFGDARLTDYKKANKVKFTTTEFKNDYQLQEDVMDWHIADIDKHIDSIEGADGWSREGLRAVAHLGGKGGMRKYVLTNGEHDPKDKFGTHLSDYYKKFK